MLPKDVVLETAFSGIMALVSQHLLGRSWSSLEVESEVDAETSCTLEVTFSLDERCQPRFDIFVVFFVTAVKKACVCSGAVCCLPSAHPPLFFNEMDDGPLLRFEHFFGLERGVRRRPAVAHERIILALPARNSDDEGHYSGTHIVLTVEGDFYEDAEGDWMR